MSLKKCVDNAVAAGELTLEEGQRLKKRYDDLAKQILSKGAVREQMAAELEAQAEQKKRIALLTETGRQRLEALVLNHVNASGYNDPAGALPLLFEKMEEGRFESVEARKRAILRIIMTRMGQVVQEFQTSAKFTGDMMRRVNPYKAARLDNMVREIHGESTGDQSAAALAKIVSEVLEDLRQQFNAAGGAVGKLSGGYLPQHHSREALMKVGQEKWVAYLMEPGRLDREKMVNPITGFRFTDDDLQEALREAWLTITTDGLNKREPSGQPRGKGALYKQHADHRFIHFKNADEWLKYQKDFGEADPFAAITSHISVMARDIAMMEVLTPNPVSMFNYLKDVVTKHAKMARPNNIIREEQLAKLKQLIRNAPDLEEIRENIQRSAIELDALRFELNRKLQLFGDNDAPIVKLKQDIAAKEKELDAHSAKMIAETEKNAGGWELLDENGVPVVDPTHREIQALMDSLRQKMPDHLSDPVAHADRQIAIAEQLFEGMRGRLNVPLDEGVARFWQNARNLTAAAKLQGASISALTDPMFHTMARNVAGMPSDNLLFKTIAGYVSMLLPGGRQAAEEAGMFAETALHTLHREARFAASINSTGITGFIADRVLTFNFLKPWTQAGKDYFALAFSSALAQTRNTPFHKLTPEWRRTFEANGMNAELWAKLASIPPTRVRGVELIKPADIYLVDRDLALKVLGAMDNITRIAVPEPSNRVRGFMYQGTRPGSGAGEFLRLATQFKSFSFGIAFTHLPLVKREWQRGNKVPAALLGASFFVRMMILGAIVVQLKNLAYGKDPQEMDDEKFWLAAIAQGGGLGIYGDFIFADQNRFGSGPTATAAGPVIGSLLDPALKLTIGNLQELGEDKTNFGREAVRFARGVNPFGTFYTRLATDRLVFDTLQEWADPKAPSAWRRLKKRRRKEMGSGYWWGPGEDLEDIRPPDFGAAVR
jgi:hypothetical protein